MDVLFRLGLGGVSEVRGALPDPPSYSAVRTMLGRLEEKGYVRHRRAGQRYVYLPTIDPVAARESAFDRMMRTFFGGSPGRTVAALLEYSAAELSEEELEDLSHAIERLRERDP